MRETRTTENRRGRNTWEKPTSFILWANRNTGGYTAARNGWIKKERGPSLESLSGNKTSDGPMRDNVY